MVTVNNVNNGEFFEKKTKREKEKKNQKYEEKHELMKSPELIKRSPSLWLLKFNICLFWFYFPSFFFSFLSNCSEIGFDFFFFGFSWKEEIVIKACFSCIIPSYFFVVRRLSIWFHVWVASKRPGARRRKPSINFPRKAEEEEEEDDDDDEGEKASDTCKYQMMIVSSSWFLRVGQHQTATTSTTRTTAKCDAWVCLNFLHIRLSIRAAVWLIKLG